MKHTSPSPPHTRRDSTARRRLRTASRFVVVIALCVQAIPAQTPLPVAGDERALRPDMRRALSARTRDGDAARPNGYQPRQASYGKRSATHAANAHAAPHTASRRGNRPPVSARSIGTPDAKNSGAQHDTPPDAITNSLPPIRSGASLARVLHTSQLSLTSSDGSIESFVDQNGDGAADERTTFDRAGGAFDVAVGRSGARYEAFSATDRDDRAIGVLRVALDTNGDFMRDTSSTFDLRQTYNLRSAAAIVAGTSRTGREFVIVSSSGYYNRSDANDPDNEPSAGVLLLVRDSLTNGFDSTRTRELVRVGSNELNNANSLALLPNGDLLVADFDSNELRIVRDRDADGVPDTLDATPYYSFRYSTDAPLEVAVNSRSVVFSHPVGDDAVLLAIYDDDGDGRADAEEVAVEGLSIDDNLILHGLTVDREGSVYLIEDATGANDAPSIGGNLGTARILVFPDSALNGILRDGSVFAEADSTTLALSGLAFGTDPRLAPVARLAITNSAAMRGDATFGGLGTITGASLTDGATGATTAAATGAGLRVTMEGEAVSVLSFNAEKINIYVPPSAANASEGVRAVVVKQHGIVRAAGDVRLVKTNPAVFTHGQSGAGEAVALLTSMMRYTASPFSATINNEASVIAIFGTGWRNAATVSVTVGGQSARVEFAGATAFPGLDQINVRLPPNARGALPVLVTADNVQSRSDVVIGVQ